MDSVAHPTAEHVTAAASFISSLPKSVRAATQDPHSARALVCCLLIHDPDIAAAKVVERVDANVFRLFCSLHPLVRGLGAAARIPLLELALPSLKVLSKDERRAFLVMAKEVIWCDSRCETFEYAIFAILREQLDGRHKARISRSLPSLAIEASLWLSALAHSGRRAGDSEAAAQKAFATGVATAMTKMPIDSAPFSTRAQCSVDAMERSLRGLAAMSPRAKEVFLEACLATVSSDGHITLEEYELLQATCTVIGVPLPPLELPVAAN